MKIFVIPNEILLPDVEKILRNGMNVTLRVKGNSMLPFIHGDNDSAVLVPANCIQKGDVVLAHLKNNCYIMHRIIRLKGDNVTLMGDGNLQETECCHVSDICGKVTLILRNNKSIDLTSLTERCKAVIWQKLRPIRRYMLAIYRRIN